MEGVLLFAIVFVSGIATAVLCHEGAHILAAWALGGTGVAMTRKGLTFEVSATLATRARVLAFTLAGPAANCILGAGALVGARMSSSAWIGLVGWMHLLFAASTLIPHASSDGARALALWRKGG